MEKILIKRLNSKAVLPKYETEGAAGMDLVSTKLVLVDHNEIAIVPTGIAISLPKGYEAQVRPRSGLAAKHGITVVNSPGTIDSDYRGEIKVILTKLTPDHYTINEGERIAQLVITKVEQPILEEVEDLDSTDRGEKGFGSTGV